MEFIQKETETTLLVRFELTMDCEVDKKTNQLHSKKRNSCKTTARDFWGRNYQLQININMNVDSRATNAIKICVNKIFGNIKTV